MRNTIIEDCKSEFEFEIAKLKETHENVISQKDEEIQKATHYINALERQIDDLVIKQNQLNARIQDLTSKEEDEEYSKRGDLEEFLLKEIDKNNDGNLDPIETFTYLVKLLNPDIISDIDANQDGLLQVGEVIDYIIKKNIKKKEGLSNDENRLPQNIVK